MSDDETLLAACGGSLADILLPAPEIKLENWATIACDQYTQELGYWERVKQRVGDRPSTLHLSLPEVYLTAENQPQRIAAIQTTMAAYQSGSIFRPAFKGFVYLERDTAYRAGRRGLVMAVDLEAYDWRPSAKALIRASEDTVASRLPPRIAIRRDAALESTHVLLLIDDDERRLLEGLGERFKTRTPSYKTRLMEDSGAVVGWQVEVADDIHFIAKELTKLSQRSENRYQSNETPFVFAVGDGNHSLAAAKAVWDEYKAAHSGQAGLAQHPGRWALVEVENLYDEAIVFEPIHRVIYGTTPAALTAALCLLPGYRQRLMAGPPQLATAVADPTAPQTRFGLISAELCLLIETDRCGLATGLLQPLLDDFIAADHRCAIDYIHGTEATVMTGQQPNAVSLLLPPVSKTELFATIAKQGPLPRKSFSMGEASEKRFYLECRALFS